MTKQVTLDLPDAVYEHMKQVATADNRSFAQILADAIVQAKPTLYVHPERSAMQNEKVAFPAMHARLAEEYEDQYVAIFQGQLIDHDHDVLALAGRISRDHPKGVVLITKVADQPDRVIHFRSPRL
jgi:hypothetical protein